MTGWRSMALGAAVAVALAAALSACGGGSHDRDARVCRSCDAGVDRECYDACRTFCRAGDPDCDTRCAAQCDACRRDLVCGACVGGCTGALLRCAPSDRTVACEDGTFGGTPAIPPE
ncbi:MAG: hypothetical protein IT294_06810 [Deltaproteobacteria bacterium]|nr:hypothetical protein [Deltaproteobacteria bacterium]